MNITFEVSNYNPEGEKEIYVKEHVIEHITPEILNIKEFSGCQEKEFNKDPLVLVKKSTYSEAQRQAQAKYRLKYPEKYCKVQRDLYHVKIKDEAWKAKFNERSKINNKKYRDRKIEELKAQGIEPKKRGRPRKTEKIDVENNNTSNLTVKSILYDV